MHAADGEVSSGGREAKTSKSSEEHAFHMMTMKIVGSRRLASNVATGHSGMD